MADALRMQIEPALHEQLRISFGMGIISESAQSKCSLEQVVGYFEFFGGRRARVA